MRRPRTSCLMSAGIGLAALVAAPEDPLACSCAHFSQHQLIVGDKIPQGGGFAIWHAPGYASEAAAPVVVATTADGAMVGSEVVELAFDLWAVSFPTARAGDRLTVTSTVPPFEQESIADERVSAVLEVEPELGATTSVEMLVTAPITEEVDLISRGGGCYESRLIAYVDVEPELSKELEPFWGAVMTEIYVDDAPLPSPYAQTLCDRLRPSSSQMGHNRHRVWAECGYPDTGLAPGTYSVALRAWLPGTPHEWWSPTQTIQLECNLPTSGGDGGAPDAGAEQGAGANQGDSGADAAGAERGPGCSASPWRAPAGGLTIAVVLLLAPYLRRNRRAGGGAGRRQRNGNGSVSV